MPRVLRTQELAYVHGSDFNQHTTWCCHKSRTCDLLAVPSMHGATNQTWSVSHELHWRIQCIQQHAVLFKVCPHSYPSATLYLSSIVQPLFMLVFVYPSIVHIHASLSNYGQTFISCMQSMGKCLFPGYNLEQALDIAISCNKDKICTGQKISLSTQINRL